VYLIAGQFECFRGRIAMPLTGAWIADVTMDPSSSGSNIPAVGDPIAISLGENGFAIQGAIRRINNAFETVYARIVAGGGGLYKPVGPKAYGGDGPVTFGLILNDLLNSVGETLSPMTPAAITQISVPFWTVNTTPCFQAIASLILIARVMTSTEVNWRVLPDGTIYVGVEPWPQSPMTSFDLYVWPPQELRAEVFAVDPRVTPGQIWQSGQVSNVQHRIDPEKIRSTIWFLN
jgi:hypothetical protein